jgi:rubredoxin
MSEQARVVGVASEGYIAFWTTGEAVKGEFHCSECGYGVTVHRELPLCPMCQGTAWEQVPWSPMTRALEGRVH